MAVRLRSLRATWPRLRPLSWRACFTLPGRISTPRLRPRRRLIADGCADTSDMEVSLTRVSRHLTALANDQQHQPGPSAPAEIASASRVVTANRVEKISLRIKESPPLPSRRQAVWESGKNGGLIDRGRN